MYSKTKNNKNKIISILDMAREIIVPILVGVLFSIFVMKYVFVFAEIPSGSMIPTLQIDDKIIVNKLAYRFDEPKRFDIVVFEHKMRETDGAATILVKRIIGIPGDTIEIKNGQLYINDELQNESYLNEPMYDALGTDLGPVVVPDKHYFMMGDNRNNSFDSRDWDYMFVPKSEIWGSCELRISPKIEWIEDNK